MAVGKLSRKEIKAPDPFVHATTVAWHWMAERRRPVAYASTALGVVIAVGVVAWRVQSSRERSAGASLAGALDEARRGIEGIDYAVPGEPALFKSVQERQEVVGTALEKVRADHPGTAAALTATLHLGDLALLAGDAEGAVKSYDAYLAGSNPNQPYRVMAFEGLGYAAEAKRDFPQAMGWFEKMATDSPKGLAKDRAAFHRARMLERLGRVEEAAGAYEAVKRDFAESPVTRSAVDRRILLAMQGVVAAAQPPEPATAAGKDAG